MATSKKVTLYFPGHPGFNCGMPSAFGLALTPVKGGGYSVEVDAARAKIELARKHPGRFISAEEYKAQAKAE